MIPEQLKDTVIHYSSRKEFDIIAAFLKKVSGYSEVDNFYESLLAAPYYLGLYTHNRIAVFDETGSQVCKKTTMLFADFVIKFTNGEIKLPIFFSSFHNAEMDKKGIKFPWREQVFSLDVVRALIDAKNKVVAAEIPEKEEDNYPKIDETKLYKWWSQNGNINQIANAQPMNLQGRWTGAPQIVQPTVTVDAESPIIPMDFIYDANAISTTVMVNEEPGYYTAADGEFHHA